MKVRSIRIHNPDLRPSVYRIDRFLSTRLKIEKRRKVPDTDNDLLAVRRPARSKNQVLLLQDRARRFALVHDQEAHPSPTGFYFGDGQVLTRWVVCGQPRCSVEIEFWILAELLHGLRGALEYKAAEHD